MGGGGIASGEVCRSEDRHELLRGAYCLEGADSDMHSGHRAIKEE